MRLARRVDKFQPFLRFWSGEHVQTRVELVSAVSTLLEILGLVFLVLAGF